MAIAVIGDVMLDKYVLGSCDRLSPEAPVPIVNVDSIEYRLGGAANVANNIYTYGMTDVSLFSVTGNGYNSRVLKDLIKFHNSINYLSYRKTTIKERVLCQSKQIVRIDDEITDNIEPEFEQAILNNFKKYDYKILIISDYNKGVMTPSLIRKLIEYCNKNDIFVVVDTKQDFELYRNCDIITPNLKELYQGMNLKMPKNFNIDDVKSTVEVFLKAFNIPNILLTMSEHGMLLANKDGEMDVITTDIKDVCDVTGAGDTVLSVFASNLDICYIEYATMLESANIANTAAGIVVNKLGTATIGQDDFVL